MNEQLYGVPQRIAELNAMLKERLGKAEYTESVEAIKREIAMLTSITLKPVEEP